MALQRLVWSRRQTAARIGATVAKAPDRRTDVALAMPTEKQVPGLSTLDANLVRKLGHFMVQQCVQALASEGMVYGTGGTAFNGDVQLLLDQVMVNYRPACPALGVPVTQIPQRTVDQTLWQPTNKQVAKVETLTESQRTVIAHYWVQELLHVLSETGHAPEEFGPGSSAFAGDTTVL